MRVVTFKIDERLLEELDKYALSHGITRSDAIRRAIIDMLRGGDGRRFKYRIRKVIIA